MLDIDTIHSRYPRLVKYLKQHGPDINWQDAVPYYIGDMTGLSLKVIKQLPASVVNTMFLHFQKTDPNGIYKDNAFAG